MRHASNTLCFRLFVLGALLVLLPEARSYSFFSPLTPFPDGDIYQVTVIGDGFAEGLLSGLIDALGTDARLTIQKKPRVTISVYKIAAKKKSAVCYERKIVMGKQNIF